VTVRMLYLAFVRLTDWLDGAAGTVGGVEGCRAAGGEYAGKSCGKVRLRRSKACRRISVKPSAKPTLVRTQHLPPCKTAAQS